MSDTHDDGKQIQNEAVTSIYINQCQDVENLIRTGVTLLSNKIDAKDILEDALYYSKTLMKKVYSLEECLESLLTNINTTGAVPW